MKVIIFILGIFLLVSCVNSDKILYHEYYETASDYDITRWNINDTVKNKCYIKETVDEKGRVKQLDFLLNGKYVSGLCYLANKVTYEYIGNKIIERLFINNEPMLGNDCEVSYKSIYHLDSEKYITKIERYSAYDSINLSRSELIKWKKWVPEYSVEGLNSEQLSINYYLYSYAKMNGLYPVSINYKISTEKNFGDQPEKKSIEIGISKYKKGN
jgi:hypothetical protein